ncbi:GTPase-associated protein 1-related protein [Catenulispora subtropica]|uniref:Uncharacterized protein n=1 Tax=Catenulispora subtropica TaxID=450798 RepID=A0ABN2SZQ8_9ACTN
MVLEQLYFTSSERGHGPVAGYRFNALSPGASAEAQRDVHALVGYRPPRSQAFPAGPDELRQCPVNLCFRPGISGSPAILANVEYVGRDFSGGFGNFFAHAFAAGTAADLAEGLGGRLPIETWRSPVWVRSQSPDLTLPPYSGPLPRGGVTPAAVEAFLAGHPLADRLPLLVTAVAAAQAGWGPPVLLVETDSDRVALWIGAVSYLLPPRAAETLAFATYTAEPPALAAMHVIGTVPETAAELPLDLVHAFELFDLPAGRVPGGRPLAVAAVAARVGVGAARALWQTAATLAEPETPFDAWYGPLSAAAALNGIQLALPEDRAVAEWAARSIERLDPAAADDLALKLNQQPQWRGEDYLPILFKLAWRGRNQALCDEIRIRQIDIELARVRDGVPGASAAARIESPRVRLRVASRIRDLLESAPVGSAPGVLRLLDWARRTGLEPELETDFLVELTRWVFVPEAMSGRWTDDAADPLRAALRSWPPVRQGFVMYLRELAERGAAGLDAALDGPLGPFLRGTASFEVELAAYPELQEALWISRARQDPAQQATVLHAVLHRRGVRLPDAELLGRVWPRGWSAQEMAHVATATPLEDLDDDAVAAWFLDTLATASTPEDIPWYVTVGRRLLASPSARRLEARCVPLAKAVELDRRCRAVRDFKDLEWIARQDSTATTMIAVMVAALLPDLLTASKLDPDQVCSVLELMYPDAMRAFLAKVQTPPLDVSEAGLMRIAGVYVLAETRYHHDSVLRAELIACVDQAAGEMTEQEWEELRGLILSSRRQVEDEFLTYEESRQPPRPRFPFGLRKRG